jgi:hypothetical protein
VQPVFALMDLRDDLGCLVRASEITVTRLNMPSLVGASLLVDLGDPSLGSQGPFEIASTPEPGKFAFFTSPYQGFQTPEFATEPGDGATTSPLLGIEGRVAESSMMGLASWSSGEVFEAAGGKLIVMAARLEAMGAEGSRAPDCWLAASQGNTMASFMISGASAVGPSPVARDFYLVYDVRETGMWGVQLYALAELPTVDGRVRLRRLRVWQLNPLTPLVIACGN